MKVLVTSGNWSAAAIIMESLSKQGHDVYVLDESIYCAAFRSKYCKQGIVCASERNGVRFIDSITTIVRSQRFDLLIPVSDRATELLSIFRERIEDYVKMLLPSKGLVNLALFKNQTYAFALKNHIPIPKTYFPKAVINVIELSKIITFPCVVKNPRGTANKGNFYFEDGDDLVRFYQKLSPTEQWPMIQEYVQGDFYGFLGVADQGELLDCVMFKTDQRYTLNGTAPYCLSIYDQEFLELTRRVIKLLKWTGAINMDFLKDSDGEFRLLEINPRLSGSLDLTYKLGVDLPAIYADLAMGKIIKRFERINYKPQTHFRFVLPAEIILAMKEKGHFLNLLLNFLVFGMKTDIPWHDPKLLLWKLRHVWWYWQDMRSQQYAPAGNQ